MSKIAKEWDVSDASTADEVLSKSLTLWEPKIESISAGSAVAQGDKAIINPEKGLILGFVKPRYPVNSHVEHIRALDDLITQRVLMPKHVSEWDNGAMLAYAFQCPELDVDVGDDRGIVSPLFYLAFFHNGKGADLSFFADFRWFCKNQMGKVANVAGDGRVLHKGDNVNKYAELVQGRIGELGTGLAERYGVMRKMVQTKMPKRDMYELIGQSLTWEPEQVKNAWEVINENREPETLEQKRKSTIMSNVVECVDAEVVDNTPRTVWNVYNGITRYYTHKQGISAAGRSERLLLGSGSETLTKAFELAQATL